MNHPPWLLLVFLAMLIPSISSIQCFSGSQLQILDCPATSCIKQTMGIDTVRYCDGSGASSICQTYRVFEDCQQIPDIGYLCCCGKDFCNSAKKFSIFTGFFVFLMTVYRFL